MEFVKTMMFLGMQRRSRSNGVSYAVNMFCPGGEPWTFYIKDIPENNPLIVYLMGATSGQMVDATLRVGTYDGNVYLRLSGCEDVA